MVNFAVINEKYMYFIFRFKSRKDLDTRRISKPKRGDNKVFTEEETVEDNLNDENDTT